MGVQLGCAVHICYMLCVQLPLCACSCCTSCLMASSSRLLLLLACCVIMVCLLLVSCTATRPKLGHDCRCAAASFTHPPPRPSLPVFSYPTHPFGTFFHSASGGRWRRCMKRVLCRATTRCRTSTAHTTACRSGRWRPRQQAQRCTVPAQVAAARCRTGISCCMWPEWQVGACLQPGETACIPGHAVSGWERSMTKQLSGPLCLCLRQGLLRHHIQVLTISCRQGVATRCNGFTDVPCCCWDARQPLPSGL